MNLKEKCEVLSNIYLNLKDEEEWQDFVAYWNLTLPIAQAILMGVVLPTSKSEEMINSAWEHAEVIENEPVWGEPID